MSQFNKRVKNGFWFINRYCKGKSRGGRLNPETMRGVNYGSGSIKASSVYWK
jgi:hypothetical protein